MGHKGWPIIYFASEHLRRRCSTDVNNWKYEFLTTERRYVLLLICAVLQLKTDEKREYLIIFEINDDFFGPCLGAAMYSHELAR